MRKIRISTVVTSVVFILMIAMYAHAESMEYSIANSQYVRLLGRGEYIEGDSRTFNWANSGIEFKFTGKKAEVYVDSSTKDSDEYNGSYFNVSVDGSATPTRMKLVTGWNTIYNSETAGEHTIMLVRSSEACTGALRMSKVRCDGEPQATTPKVRKIEFIGDSYTSGYGNSPELSELNGYCSQNTDNWNSYTGFISRHFNADSNIISYQGHGLYLNWGGETTANMVEQFNYADILLPYDNMSTKATWGYAKYQPQLVTVWLGTNDNVGYTKSKDGTDYPTIESYQPVFKQKYIEFLTKIRNEYPNATVIACSRSDFGFPQQIKEAVEEMGGAEKKFYNLQLKNFSASSFSHPTVEEDRVIAQEFIDLIESIPNVWDVPSEEVDKNAILNIVANYNTNVVSVMGKTGAGNDKVTAFVSKSKISQDEFNENDLAYIFETQTNSVGEYEFRFMVDKIAGNYNFYMNSVATDSVQAREFTFRNLIPDIAVNQGNTRIKEFSQIDKNNEVSVTLSGFEVNDDTFKGMLYIAQYDSENGRLIKLSSVDASEDTTTYGSEVTENFTVEENAKQIKVMYLNQVNNMPLLGCYDIK